MTDQLPSKDVATRLPELSMRMYRAISERERLSAQIRITMLDMELIDQAAAEIQRLREDLARTESAHAVVMAENKHYKQVAREAQDRVDELECALLTEAHKHACATMVEGEATSSMHTICAHVGCSETGIHSHVGDIQAGSSQPPPAAPDWCPSCTKPYSECRCNEGKGLPR